MNATLAPISNSASRAIIPDGTTPATSPLVIAGLVSMALHGSVFAAASWLWVPTTPPEAPRLMAVAMVPEALVRSTRQSKRVATAVNPGAVRQHALAALRAAKRLGQTAAVPATQPAKGRQSLVDPVWDKAPPAPPPLPNFRLRGTLEPPPWAQPKPRTPDPRVDKPVMIKPTTVTAVTAVSATGPPIAAPAGPPMAAPEGAGSTGQIAKTDQGKAPGTKGPPRPVAGLGNPAPAYPWISRRRGEQGRVILDVAVTADGHARKVRIKRSSGSARLDQAALAAVRKWRFSPALSGGRTVAGRIEIPIAFRLTK